MVVGRNQFLLILSSLVILVGSLVFLKWALIGRSLPRDLLVEKKLRVLSYSVFVSQSGPAPALVKQFEEACQCQVEFVTAGDGGLLLERLKMTQTRAHFDLVLGLDQFWANKALKEWQWRSPSLSLPSQKWALPLQNFMTEAMQGTAWPFVPFDYAPMTFIYRKSDVPSPPRSFEDLLDPRFKSSLSLQDPRSSSPGLQFLSWVHQIKKENTLAYLKNLRPSIHSVSPSWALSYGLFKKEQSQFVFSYLTSLAFHQRVEKDPRYSAVSFDFGHPLQVEFIGIPEGGQHYELAQQFIEFLLKPSSQKMLAAKNFMYPARSDVYLEELFHGLPDLKVLPLQKQMPDLQLWDRAFQ